MCQIKHFIQEFILGRLIIYHSFTLDQKMWPLKKNSIAFGNQLKVANYTGCQTKFTVQN